MSLRPLYQLGGARQARVVLLMGHRGRRNDGGCGGCGCGDSTAAFAVSVALAIRFDGDAGSGGVTMAVVDDIVSEDMSARVGEPATSATLGRWSM